MVKRIVVVLGLLLLMALPLATAGPKPLSPVGQITFEARTLGLGATFTWGRGWLTFQGKTYPIKVEGLGIVGLGYSKVNAIGKVYNLKTPLDITGT